MRSHRFSERTTPTSSRVPSQNPRVRVIDSYRPVDLHSTVDARRVVSAMEYDRDVPLIVPLLSESSDEQDRPSTSSLRCEHMSRRDSATRAKRQRRRSHQSSKPSVDEILEAQQHLTRELQDQKENERISPNRIQRSHLTSIEAGVNAYVVWDYGLQDFEVVIRLATDMVITEVKGQSTYLGNTAFVLKGQRVGVKWAPTLLPSTSVSKSLIKVKGLQQREVLRSGDVPVFRSVLTERAETVSHPLALMVPYNAQLVTPSSGCSVSTSHDHRQSIVSEVGSTSTSQPCSSSQGSYIPERQVLTKSSLKDTRQEREIRAEVPMLPIVQRLGEKAISTVHPVERVVQATGVPGVAAMPMASVVPPVTAVRSMQVTFNPGPVPVVSAAMKSFTGTSIRRASVELRKPPTQQTVRQIERHEFQAMEDRMAQDGRILRDPEQRERAKLYSALAQLGLPRGVDVHMPRLQATQAQVERGLLVYPMPKGLHAREGIHEALKAEDCIRRPLVDRAYHPGDRVGPYILGQCGELIGEVPLHISTIPWTHHKAINPHNHLSGWLANMAREPHYFLWSANRRQMFGQFRFLCKVKTPGRLREYRFVRRYLLRYMNALSVPGGWTGRKLDLDSTDSEPELTVQSMDICEAVQGPSSMSEGQRGGGQELAEEMEQVQIVLPAKSVVSPLPTMSLVSDVKVPMKESEAKEVVNIRSESAVSTNTAAEIPMELVPLPKSSSSDLEQQQLLQEEEKKDSQMTVEEIPQLILQMIETVDDEGRDKVIACGIDEQTIPVLIPQEESLSQSQVEVQGPILGSLLVSIGQTGAVLEEVPGPILESLSLSEGHATGVLEGVPTEHQVIASSLERLIVPILTQDVLTSQQSTRAVSPYRRVMPLVIPPGMPSIDNMTQDEWEKEKELQHFEVQYARAQEYISEREERRRRVWQEMDPYRRRYSENESTIEHVSTRRSRSEVRRNEPLVAYVQNSSEEERELLERERRLADPGPSDEAPTVASTSDRGGELPLIEWHSAIYREFSPAEERDPGGLLIQAAAIYNKEQMKYRLRKVCDQDLHVVLLKGVVSTSIRETVMDEIVLGDWLYAGGLWADDLEGEYQWYGPNYMWGSIYCPNTDAKWPPAIAGVKAWLGAEESIALTANSVLVYRHTTMEQQRTNMADSRTVFIPMQAMNITLKANRNVNVQHKFILQIGDVVCFDYGVFDNWQYYYDGRENHYGEKIELWYQMVLPSTSLSIGADEGVGNNELGTQQSIGLTVDLDVSISSGDSTAAATQEEDFFTA